MGDTRLDDDRLPWLDAPRRPAVKAPPRPVRRPRPNARTPIFVLLSLFFLGGIGLISFLAGRGSVFPGDKATVSRPDSAQATMNLPPPSQDVAGPDAPAVESAQVAPANLTRAVEPVRARPAAPPRRPRISARTVSNVKRRGPQAAVEAAQPEQVPDIVWQPSPPPAVPGRVIELGVYSSPALADAAFRRIARVYPYLARRPRVVALDKPVPGQPIRYRLQLGARTKSDARRLCRNLLSIGRGCRVVPG